jgi:hypothetical protein
MKWTVPRLRVLVEWGFDQKPFRRKVRTPTRETVLFCEAD